MQHRLELTARGGVILNAADIRRSWWACAMWMHSAILLQKVHRDQLGARVKLRNGLGLFVLDTVGLDHKSQVRKTFEEFGDPESGCTITHHHGDLGVFGTSIEEGSLGVVERHQHPAKGLARLHHHHGVGGRATDQAHTRALRNVQVAEARSKVAHTAVERVVGDPRVGVRRRRSAQTGTVAEAIDGLTELLVGSVALYDGGCGCGALDRAAALGVCCAGLGRDAHSAHSAHRVVAETRSALLVGSLQGLETALAVLAVVLWGGLGRTEGEVDEHGGEQQHEEVVKVA
mmetsp:Transcript_15737/g.47201  ORF Transcript_15737/g.47201 Transcript_15737/m.47201 type:complete len:288 (+) Transcript_15737:1602-2465(+)